MAPCPDLPAPSLTPQQGCAIQGIFTDIDDTLSTHGKLTAPAFEALWRLHEVGLRVVIVTGRPAGWCDHIARFWPVDAVVGENGGFYFHHDGHRLQRRFLYPADERREFSRRLEAIWRTIQTQVPGCALASDQPYRECDWAVDFCEDVHPLPRGQILRIKALFEESGAHAKISSIHVNGWFGDFDKLSTARLCVRELFGIDLDAQRHCFIFCGDSPNDEPMFQYFPLSFGMANIRPYLDLMAFHPAQITSEPGGAGFSQVAGMILQARAAQSQIDRS